MFCLKCGKEIENGAKFCPHCGAVISAASDSAQGGPSVPTAPVYTMPETNGTAQWSSAPQGGNKRRGGGLIIGGAVAVVVVIAVIIAAIGGLFASPKGQVEKALAKTMGAYSDAKNKMGAADLDQLVKDRSYSQSFSLELGSINQQLTGWYDLSSLRNIGVRVDADYDQKARKMDFVMAAYYDGEDLASIEMLVNDSKMTFASPEFTKGSAYGFNTETLGADLHELGVDDSQVNVKKLGFNLFDLMDKATPSDAQTKEMEKAVADANKQLFNAIEVEKDGKQSIDVNGKSTDATLYHVVIPKNAMKDYINAMEDAMKAVDSQAMMKDMLQSMGFDKSTVNEIMSQMGTTDVYGQMASAMKEAVKTIGDLELDVYVSGGYVCAVEYSGRIQGSKLKAGLYLGGGANYVDDLSLEIAADGQKITVESSGDHAGKSGVFTDETTIRVGSNRITSELRWEPKAAKNNFEWALREGSVASISMEGQLTTTKNSVDLKLDDLSVSAAGSKLLSLQGSYYLGPCKDIKVSHSSPKLLGDMDEDDLEDLYYDIEENAEEWMDDMAGLLPPDLFYYLW